MQCEQRKVGKFFLDYRTNRFWSDKAGIREFKYTLEEELQPYLDKEDFDYIMTKTNKATQTISLQSKQLKELRKRGLIEDFRHMEMENILVEFFNLQGKSERIKNFPYPRQFATLNHNFVWIFIIILPFGVMNEFNAIGMYLIEEHPFFGANFIWLTIPFSVVVSWVFHTMNRIGKVGENPFEGTANDVPITTISRGIEIDLREMLDENPETIPKPIEEKYNIQM